MKLNLLRKVGAKLAWPFKKISQFSKAGFLMAFLILFPFQAAHAEVVDTLAGWAADALTYAAQGAGKVVVIMIGILINIAQYNDFVNSPAVGAGWAVVRDAVNMFFVIIFILIAFGTILGIDRFKWRQQVPKLLLMAIFINFSRTLCGIMIDFSQIFTLTFVNAIKDIAGGNFIQMFGLADIMDANEGATALIENGVSKFDLLVAAACALIMMLIVLVSVVFLTIVLAYRIVLLWALVTVAPLCWFFKGTEGVLKTKKDPYGTWWGKFSCALQIGPILTFFLWLALAVAGSGADVAGFGGTSSPDATILIKAMDPGKLINFLVGIMLLVVGLDAANDACASTDGIISGLMGKAKGIGKTIAAAPLTLGAGAAGWAAAGAGGLALKGGKAVGQGLYKNTVGRGVEAAKNKTYELAGKQGAKGGMFSNALLKYSSKGEAGRAAKIKQATEEAGPMGEEQMLNYLQKGPGKLVGDRQEYLGRMREAMSNDKIRAKLGPDGVRKLLERQDGKGQTIQSSMDTAFKGDASYLKEQADLKKKAPSYFGDEALKKIQSKEDLEGIGDEMWQDEKFRGHLGTKDYTYQDKATGQQQKEMVDDEKNPGQKRALTLAEAAERGYLGDKKQAAWQNGSKEIAKKFEPKTLLEKKASDITAGDLRPESVDVATGETVASNLTPEVAAKLMSEGNSSHFAAIAANGKLKADLSKSVDKVLERAEKDAYSSRVDESGFSESRDGKKVAGVKANMVEAGVSLAQAFSVQGDGSFNTSDTSNEGKAASEQARQDFASALNNSGVMAAALETTPKGSEAYNTAFSQISAGFIKGLAKKLENIPAANTSERAGVEAQMATIKTALEQKADAMNVGSDEYNVNEGIKVRELLDSINRRFPPVPPTPPTTTP